MSRISRQLQTRPRTALSVSVVIAAILVMTLIPFRVDRTIGYEVAVAGVNTELAFDDNRLNELLTALDLPDAHFHVGECDRSCRVTIRDIPTERQAEMLVAAFKELNGVKIEYMIAVDTVQDLTLIQNARNVFRGEATTYANREATIQTVKERIDSLHRMHNGDFNVFFTPSESEAGTFEVLMGDSTRPTQAIFNIATDGAGRIPVADENGNMILIDPNDPEFKARLEAAGGVITDGELQFHSRVEDSGAARTTGQTALPDDFALSQNYPNPFNPSTTIEFTLPQAAHVTLSIFNINGQRVRTLLDGERGAGTHRVEWDATGDAGQRLASGVYLYRLSAGDQVATKKMTLLK